MESTNDMQGQNVIKYLIVSHSSSCICICYGSKKKCTCLLNRYLLVVLSLLSFLGLISKVVRTEL